MYKSTSVFSRKSTWEAAGVASQHMEPATDRRGRGSRRRHLKDHLLEIPSKQLTVFVTNDICHCFQKKKKRVLGNLYQPP